jgi:citronellol/citronellal dehydrogenase
VSLNKKVIFITGGSRGIGLAIAKRAAQDGARIVIAAKTTEPHPKLPGTIYTAADEIREHGGEALPIQTDIRNEDEIQAAVDLTVKTYGGIDILINNASAISLTDTLNTSMKQFDLMNQINTRGTFATSKACLPHLLKASNPHILTLSPPLNMKPKWFSGHIAYTMAKYGMSMCVLGLAEELKKLKVAVNALWPETTIATAALNLVGGDEILKASRTPEIVAEAAYWILTQPSDSCTGNFFIDEDILRAQGVTDFSAYAYAPGNALNRDLFLEN